MNRTRYLLIATHVPGSGAGGGMIRYAVELVRGLAARDDVDLHVLATGDGADFFRSLTPGPTVHTVLDCPIVLRSLLERYVPVRLLTGTRFDVVHGTKHLVPRFVSGATRVMTAHDMVHLDRPHDFGLVKRWLLRRPYLRSAEECEVILAVSRATRRRLVDYRPRVADAVTVVPLAPGLPDEVAPEPVPELVGRRFALVVGDSSARKNLALAVDTWPKVTASCPGAVLAVVGPRSWSDEHRGERWAEQVRSGAIRPLGHVPDSVLRWCYENAAVVLCPSLLEGFGLPTVEAAALGAPVLTSDDPALCEASAQGSGHVTGWAPDTWAVEVVKRLLVTVRPQPADTRRTWADVTRETVAAARASEMSTVEAEPDPVGVRSGVDPFAAPLVIRHVADTETVRGLGALVDAQRRGGWSVVDQTPADVTVLWGVSAARSRRTRSAAAGSSSTVVHLGAYCPRWPRDLALAAWLMRHADAVILTTEAAAEAWSRLPVPLALVPGVGAAHAAELSAVLARARAWGRQPRTV